MSKQNILPKKSKPVSVIDVAEAPSIEDHEDVADLQTHPSERSYKRPDEAFDVPVAPSSADVIRQMAAKTIAPQSVSAYLVLLDVFLILFSGLVAYVMLASTMQETSGFGLSLLFIAGAGIFCLFAQALTVYKLSIVRSRVRHLGRLFASWSLTFGFFLIAFSVLPSIAIASQNFFGAWLVTGFVLLLPAHLLFSSQVVKWTEAGLLERRAVIVGGGKNAEEVIKSLEEQGDSDIRICGIFDDRDDTRSPEMVAGYPKLGNLSELVQFGRECKLDMLIVALPITAGGRVREMLKQLWVLPVDIRLSAHDNKMAFKDRSHSYVGSLPFLNLADKPIAGWADTRKRVFDLVVGSLALVMLSPLFVATAIAIRMDSKGPIFFRQKRHGFNNEIIDVWKFRSMYHDRCDERAAVVVTKGDPRVTKVGRFIRKTSIDELPQLFNVIVGELSLVGPRPHAVHAHVADQPWSEVVDGYFARHRVKPGVTGWAQINGWRGEVDTLDKIEKRTDFDLYYIENWSLWFDIKILALTPSRLMNTENAY